MTEYVWEVWTYLGCRRPSVSKYVLVKKNDAGGVTVRVRGGTKVIRTMAGKKFFYDEASFKDFMRKWCVQERDWARTRVERLDQELANGTFADDVDVVNPDPRPVKLN
jgi:hypothetical protein